MTEAQLAELHHHRFVLGIERAVMINREELPHPTFASASQNVAAAVALLDTLPAPSTDGVDKVYQQLKDIPRTTTASSRGLHIDPWPF
jgi:hypothetical protein